MYLMSISNLDYVCISMFFGMLALTAYMFRRQNMTSSDFLLPIGVNKTVSVLVTIGVLEIVLGGYLGSTLGLQAVYLLCAVVVIAECCLPSALSHLYSNAKVDNFNAYITVRLGAVVGVIAAVLYVLLCLGLVVVTMLVTAKLFHALLGWNFVNSVVGVTGLGVICLIIGGVRGAVYNKIVQLGIIIVVLVLIGIAGIAQLGGMAALLEHLTQYAVSQHKVATYYTQLQFDTPSISKYVLLLTGVWGLYVLDVQIVVRKTRKISYSLLAAIAVCGLVIFLVLPGMLALTTKVTTHTIAGKEIITVQAQLPDGQTGYIVRAVTAGTASSNSTPGIIPEQIDPTSGITLKNKYNYLLATPVVLRHYIPGYLQFLILLMIFAGFLLAISTYLLAACRVILHNLLLPSNWISHYGDIGQLWAIRLGILGLSAIALIIASLVVPLNYNLLQCLWWMVVGVILPLLVLFAAAIALGKNTQV